MRTALRQNPSRRQVSVGASIPAPVGGWNAQSPLAAMKPTDAVILDNWIPRPGYVELRRGYVKTLDLPAPVETVMTWRGAGPGGDSILSAAGAHIYAQDGTDLYSGALSARWQSVNFSNDAGRFILAVNGLNTPTGYDGTSFTDLTITGSSGPITLVPEDLSDIMSHKMRVFLTEKNSLRVWFLDVEAIQGTAQLLDLGPVFQKGGSLTCMQPWSLDGGAGQDDFAVFMTNQGEVAIYQGEDPSDATNWALVGTFSLGLPLGPRALIKYGSDLAVLTTDGIIPLSQALKLDRAQDNLVALTQKIQNAFSAATTAYKANFGWQATFYQKGQLGIVNIPVGGSEVSEQYVQNVQTGAWCKFTNIPAFCWSIANDNIYFGATDGLYQWDVGSTDIQEPITGDLETAFNYFGERGRDKKFEMIRPIIRADQSIQPAIELVTDYRDLVPVAIPTNDAVGAIAIRNDWTSVTGVGYCAAARMRVTTSRLDADILGVDSVDVLGVDADTELGIEPPPASGDVTVQVISFDLLYQRGGQL